MSYDNDILYHNTKVYIFLVPMLCVETDIFSLVIIGFCCFYAFPRGARERGKQKRQGQLNGYKLYNLSDDSICMSIDLTKYK